MPLLSYARNGEDIVLHRALGDVAQGRYIDVGARRPRHASATRLLYERGWVGINVVPGRDDHALFLAERPRDLNLNVIAVARSGLVKPSAPATAGDGGSDEVRTVSREIPGLALADICEGFKDDEVHLLRIEAGGEERAVLEGADFTTFRPWIVLVHVGGGGETGHASQPWRRSLEQAGYRCVLFDGLNLFFLAEEHAERREALGTPANAHDGFVSAAMHELETRAAELEQERRAEADRHADELAALRDELQREVRARDDAESALAAAAEASKLLRLEVETLSADQRAVTSRNVRLQSMLDHQATHFRQQLQDSRTRIDELKRRSLDASSLAAELDRHRLDADRLRRISALVGDPERSTRLDDVWRVQKSLHARLETWRHEVEAELGHLHAELAASREQERMLLASTSWRLTEPLRRLRKATHVLRREPRLVPGMVYRQVRRFAGRSHGGTAEVPPGSLGAAPPPRSMSLQVAEDLQAATSRIEHVIGGIEGLFESISTVMREVDGQERTSARDGVAQVAPTRLERNLATALKSDVARRREQTT